MSQTTLENMILMQRTVPLDYGADMKLKDLDPLERNAYRLYMLAGIGQGYYCPDGKFGEYMHIGAENLPLGPARQILDTHVQKGHVREVYLKNIGGTFYDLTPSGKEVVQQLGNYFTRKAEAIQK